MFKRGDRLYCVKGSTDLIQGAYYTVECMHIVMSDEVFLQEVLTGSWKVDHFILANAACPILPIGTQMPLDDLYGHPIPSILTKHSVRCECGTASVGGFKHSDYCPLGNAKA